MCDSVRGYSGELPSIDEEEAQKNLYVALSKGVELTKYNRGDH